MIVLKMMMIVFTIHKVHCLQGKNKPHILLIVADDLGWNDVSWHNHDVLTPNLRDLALGGVRLNRSYVLPICTPTRSALLTGRYPFTIGRQRSTLRPCEPTGLTLNATLLPQTLKAAGYSTHAVGKWHLGYCSWDYTPTYRGFDTFFGYYNGAENYLTHMRGTLLDPNYEGESVDDILQYQNRKNELPHEYLDLRNNTEPDPSQNGTYSTHMFASYVENLLESRNPADPMFLYLPFQSVHAPLMVPENYTKPYKHIKNMDRRIYLGMVTALDEAVGKIVGSLKKTGHYENSVIIFTTDNGGTWLHGGNNWPLRGMKTSLWEGGTRGVAFVHSPLLPNSGTVSNRLIHATDWYPTLAGLAGGKAPSNTDGFDQWKAISGLERSPRIRMVYNIDNTDSLRASVRIGNYKLIVGYPGKDDWFPPPELEKPPKDIPDRNKLHSKRRKYLSEKRNLMKTHDSKSKNRRKIKSMKRDYVSKNVLHSQIKDSLEDRMHNSIISLAEQSSIKSWKPQTENQHLSEEKSITTWGFLLEEYFKGSNWLKARPQALEIFKNSTEIRLYHITDDPEERNDLSAKKIHKVKTLLEFILDEMANRYVTADVRPFDPKGDPKNWNGVFTPGWCQTE